MYGGNFIFYGNESSVFVVYREDSWFVELCGLLEW